MAKVVPNHKGFLHPENADKGELEDLFADNEVEKYNTCHGARGRFCSGSGGGGGGGGGLTISQEGADVKGSGGGEPAKNKDLPPWMRAKTNAVPLAERQPPYPVPSPRTRTPETAALVDRATKARDKNAKQLKEYQQMMDARNARLTRQPGESDSAFRRRAEEYKMQERHATAKYPQVEAAKKNQVELDEAKFNGIVRINRENPDELLHLAQFAGETVAVSYWVEAPRSGPNAKNPDKIWDTRCIRDVHIAGTKYTVDHMWVQEPPVEVKSGKRDHELPRTGTKFTGKGKIMPYRDGAGTLKFVLDYMGEIVDRGHDPALEAIAIKSMDETLSKYNQCHGAGGKFCSGTSGGGGGGGAAPVVGVHTGPVYVMPKETTDSLQDKKFQIPENITADEYSSLRKYGGTDYALINTQLRNPEAKGISERNQFLIKNIDSAIDKQEPLKAPMKVYRGTEYSRLFGKRKPEEIVGAKIKDPGFMSTSSNSEVAERFGSARFTITVPAGSKALDMAKNTGTIAARSEREFLLPRNTQIEITHVTQTKGNFLGMGKKTYIEARVVPIEKALLEKYNHNHGPGGRFAGGSSGGGGGKSSFQNTPAELTEEETKAVEDYVGPGFIMINKALRGKEPMTPDIQKTVDAMDSAMAKFPLAKDVTVFRGIKSTKFLGPTPTEKKLVGAIISDKGFTSTSMNTETAAGFAMSSRKEGVSMQIKVPKGTKALDIRNHVFSDSAFEEHEILLNRGTRMKITSAKARGNGFDIIAEVI